MRLIIFLTISFHSIFLQDTFSQTANLKLVASIDRPYVYEHDDLLIRLSLANQSKQNLLIHKYLEFGYISMCSDDFCFEVEKYKNGKYYKMPENSLIQKIPLIDSLGNLYSEIFDTLQVGQILTKQININVYYAFNKGKYRLRFSFQLLDKKNTSLGQTISEWLYFDVKSKYVIPKMR